MLSVVLPRWVDVVSTNFASLLFMPWFMLYLHISHVLCLQLPSICTQFIALLIPLCTYTYLLYHEHHPSLDFYNVKLTENTHSTWSPWCCTLLVWREPFAWDSQSLDKQNIHRIWLKPAARPSRWNKCNYVIQWAILTWYNTHISILKQFVPFPRLKVSFANYIPSAIWFICT